MAVTDSISDGFTLADLETMPDDGRRYEVVSASTDRIDVSEPVDLHLPLEGLCSPDRPGT